MQTDIQVKEKEKNESEVVVSLIFESQFKLGRIMYVPVKKRVDELSFLN
jgi:hypothetical protein